MNDCLILGYWGCRARGQVPRLLLAFTEAQWKEKRYMDIQSWHDQDKLNLGIQFPNLPYLIDGNVKISETHAVSRYIINRSGKKQLLGKNLIDQAYIDNLLGVENDTMDAIRELFFVGNYEERLPKSLQKITSKLDRINKFYGEKEWAMGYLTIVDFFISELAYYVKQVSLDLYHQNSCLERVLIAIRNLPEIQKYYNSPEAMKFPFMPDYCNVCPKQFI